jgi:hypothetical protein
MQNMQNLNCELLCILQKALHIFLHILHIVLHILLHTSIRHIKYIWILADLRCRRYTYDIVFT